MRLLLISVILACSACSKDAHSRAPLTKAEVASAAQRGFAAADVNKDHEISHEEWVFQESRAAVMIPEASRRQYVASLESAFKRLDLDGNGSISFAEYTTDNHPRYRAGWTPLKRVYCGLLCQLRLEPPREDPS